MKILLTDDTLENGRRVIVAHDLDYTLVAQGDTPEAALSSLAEVRDLYLQTCAEQGIDPRRPMPVDLLLEFVDEAPAR